VSLRGLDAAALEGFVLERVAGAGALAVEAGGRLRLDVPAGEAAAFVARRR
jgi:hypothetical protein